MVKKAFNYWPLSIVKSYCKRANTLIFADANVRTLVRNITANDRKTFFHCCIQKSASQWFQYFWNDPAIQKYTNLFPVDPDDNFQTLTRRTKLRLKFLPGKCIISPLFIRYPDFKQLPKPENHKSFFVMRDPRDIIVSSYFSIRFSHPLNNDIQIMRDTVAGMSKEDGLAYMIELSESSFFPILDEWINAEFGERLLLCKYEDMFGEKQLEAFIPLMEHLEIPIPKNELQDVLQRNQFKKVSGREKGKENIQHHYRKGVANDWINHFTPQHKDLIKERAGKLLIDLEYESGMDW